MFGTKRYINIAGRKVPAIQVSDSWTEQVELANGKRIPRQFAELVSLRETNPNGPNPGQVYLTQTPENLSFTNLRDQLVVGLDVDEDGTLITIAELEERRGENIRQRQLARLAAQTPQVVSLSTPAVEAD